MPEQVLISIIIPAFNEEKVIVDTLHAINSYPPPAHYEVVVVDNASTDDTPRLAEKHGAKLVRHPIGTISSVRNHGVAESQGEILIFLDADVLVTEGWAKTLAVVIDELIKSPMTLTGSRCLPVSNGNWFNRHWFARLAHYDAPYINSGHLITTRTLFDSIGGFSEHLKTAEDYDFCMKAKNTDAIIKNNPKLPVIHLGYPQTIKHFIARERWHGREDFESLSSFLESKVGWAAAFNLLLPITAVIATTTTVSVYPLLSYVIVMYFVSITLTIYKFRFPIRGNVFPTAAVFYAYLCGRSLSLIDRFFGKNTDK